MEPSQLATIGDEAAVADVGRLRLAGLVAWLLCGGDHIHLLIGFRNRLVVAPNWLRSCVTLERDARLIPGEEGRSPGDRWRAAGAEVP